MSTTERNTISGSEVAIRDALRMQDLSPAYAEIAVISKILHLSGYFRDVQDQAQAITKILFGRELGLSPIISISGIFIIEGKPALSANLLAATIKRSGKYDYRIVAWDSTQCEIMFREKRDGEWKDIGPSRFDMDDANRAGIANKGTWAKYPKAMLFARALSQGERVYCPDVSAFALYVPEELGATVNESGEVMTAQDLPRSKRPVEFTTEDIPLTLAVKHPAVPSHVAVKILDIAPTGSIETLKSVDKEAATAESRMVARELPAGFLAPTVLPQGVPAIGRNVDGNGDRYIPKPAVGVRDIPKPTAPVNTVKMRDGEPEEDWVRAIDATEANAKTMVAPIPASTPEYINLNKQRAIHRHFRDALPPEMQTTADVLLADWLRVKKLIWDGKPSAKVIREDQFDALLNEAVAFAKGLATDSLSPADSPQRPEDRIW